MKDTVDECFVTRARIAMLQFIYDTYPLVWMIENCIIQTEKFDVWHPAIEDSFAEHSMWTRSNLHAATDEANGVTV